MAVAGGGDQNFGPRPTPRAAWAGNGGTPPRPGRSPARERPGRGAGSVAGVRGRGMGAASPSLHTRRKGRGRAPAGRRGRGASGWCLENVAWCGATSLGKIEWSRYEVVANIK